MNEAGAPSQAPPPLSRGPVQPKASHKGERLKKDFLPDSPGFLHPFVPYMLYGAGFYYNGETPRSTGAVQRFQVPAILGNPGWT